MRLHRPVDDLQRHVRRGDLDHGDFLLGHLVAGGVHLPRRVQRQEARLVDHDARLGDALARHALVGNRLVEGDALQRALAHQFQRALGQPDQAHAVVDAARAEAALGDFETAPFAEQDVGNGYAHVLEIDFAVAVRRMVVAEHAERAHAGDSGRLHRHQDHRLLVVPAGIVGIGLAHEDEDLAARIGRAGGPPLAAVDHVVIAVTDDARLDVGGIGGRHGRLGHGEAGADLAFEQRHQPFVALCVVAVALDGLHVAGVGRRAVEGFRRDVRAAHDFAQGRVFEVGQPGAALGLRQEEVPQPGGAGLLLELLHDHGRHPGVALGAVGFDLMVEHILVRIDVFVHEGVEALLQVLDLGGVIEIHGVSLSGGV